MPVEVPTRKRGIEEPRSLHGEEPDHRYRLPRSLARRRVQPVPPEAEMNIVRVLDAYLCNSAPLFLKGSTALTSRNLHASSSEIVPAAASWTAFSNKVVSPFTSNIRRS
jgi:hypothetical protein